MHLPIELVAFTLVVLVFQGPARASGSRAGGPLARSHLSSLRPFAVQADVARPRLANVVVRGAEKLSPRVIARLLGLKRGEKLSTGKIDEGLERIKGAYLKAGFIRADVSLRQVAESDAGNAREAYVMIEILINEGQRFLIRRIEVSGNHETYYKTVLRLAGLRPGEPYDPRATTNWMQGLNRSGRFMNVKEGDIQITVNDRRHFVDVVINLSEK